MPRFTRAAIGALIALAAVPAAADAATVQVANGKTGPFAFDLLAAANEINDVRIAETADGGYVISDSAPLRIAGDDDGEGCRLDGGGDVVCSGVFPRDIALGDGNDVVRYLGSSPSAAIKGGAGNDTIFAGIRRNARGTLTIEGGSGTADKVTYAVAGFPATVSLDGQPNDGVRGDANNVMPDVEIVEGSAFGDTITGSDADETERFVGGGGNDSISGLGGTDIFDEGAAPNGADTFNGGAGIDLVDYDLRTSGVNVSLDLQRNDGAPGELDFVDPNVNDVSTGIGSDVLTGTAGPNRLSGGAGADTITALGGDDRLSGGPGVDGLLAGPGDDVVEAIDASSDDIRCDIGDDVLLRDLLDGEPADCETVERLGVLALAAEGSTVRLSWTHPQGWKQLRTVTLKLRRGDDAVGRIAIRPHARRIDDSGAVRVMRSRLIRRGEKVTARMNLRYDGTLAGKVLRADVVAVDVRGGKQVEREAATIRVAL
jgi:Ca2+-binding RTX toxin-like protein